MERIMRSGIRSVIPSVASVLGCVEGIVICGLVGVERVVLRRLLGN